MRQGILVVLLCLLVGGRVMAAPAPKEHPAKADLIADVSAARPGQSFHVAVRIQMNDGYHVYWVNPGDSGQPTEVKWTAPEGWTIEPLPFPTPKRFTLPGDIVNLGYEGAVLLLAKVTPPANAKGPVDLAADVDWLVCNEDRCIPGGAKTSLKLPVSEQVDPANQAVFQSAKAAIPTRLEDLLEAPPAGGSGDGKAFTYDLKLKLPLKNAEVFLAPGDSWDVSNTSLSDGKQAKLTFTARPLSPHTKPVSMLVLIAYDDDSGTRRSASWQVQLKP